MLSFRVPDAGRLYFGTKSLRVHDALSLPLLPLEFPRKQVYSGARDARGSMSERLQEERNQGDSNVCRGYLASKVLGNAAHTAYGHPACFPECAAPN